MGELLALSYVRLPYVFSFCKVAGLLCMSFNTYLLVPLNRELSIRVVQCSRLVHGRPYVYMLPNAWRTVDKSPSRSGLTPFVSVAVKVRSLDLIDIRYYHSIK